MQQERTRGEIFAWHINFLNLIKTALATRYCESYENGIIKFENGILEKLQNTKKKF